MLNSSWLRVAAPLNARRFYTSLSSHNVIPENEKIHVRQVYKDHCQLSNRCRFYSPFFFVNYQPLLWRVSSFKDINEDAFAILHILENKPDILLVGTGEKSQALNPMLLRHLHSLGIQVEVSGTKMASATYNILLDEGRNVAAALFIDPNRE